MFPDPEIIATQLREQLLRRGFPCFLNYLQIQFCTGLFDEDYDYLRNLIGAYAVPAAIEGPIDSIPLITLVHENGEVFMRFQTILAELIEHILSHPKNEPSACLSLSLDQAPTFKPRLLVQHLDPGIALLVKNLDNYQINVQSACAGHKAQNIAYSSPSLLFASAEDAEKCQHIFNHVFYDLPIAQTWAFSPEFAHDGSETIRFLAHTVSPEINTLSPEQYKATRSDLAYIAKRLLDPQLQTIFSKEDLCLV
jgi:hypothetical protein